MTTRSTRDTRILATSPGASRAAYNVRSACTGIALSIVGLIALLVLLVLI
ncbi:MULTISPECIES: hypothetical protein [unclassified Gordonia (in: high G+C Gram-positive bacteria)]